MSRGTTWCGGCGWRRGSSRSRARTCRPWRRPADPTKSALRRFVEEGYEGAASYHQKRGLVEELHAFLTQMRVGDTVATIGDGRLHVGQITGEAVQSASPGGLSNLRRTVAWRADGHAYEELPEEVQQKLSVQHDVVDLTGVLDALDGLTGQAEGTDPAETGDTGERPAQRELTLPDITEALAAGIPVLRVKGQTAQGAEGVRLATMHAMKGLEFRAVSVLGVNEGTVPFAREITPREADPLQHDADLLRERCLLFVACTRAREALSVTWSGAPSPFLPDAA